MKIKNWYNNIYPTWTEYTAHRIESWAYRTFGQTGRVRIDLYHKIKALDFIERKLRKL